MRVALAIAIVCGLCACGDETQRPGPSTSAARPWSSAQIQGAPALSDLAILGGRLFAVCENDDRALYAVDLKGLRDGATLTAHALKLKVHGPAEIMGSDAFAREGYRIEHLWDMPIALVGVALRPGTPTRLYLAERTHRIVYWGEVLEAQDAREDVGRIDFAFSLRGARRSEAAKSDWRDHGPGLCGLSAVVKARRVEDLYAIDRGGDSPTSAALRKLDRTGGQLGATIPITDANGKRPDLRGVVWQPDEERFLGLVGGGRGALVPFQDSNLRTVRLGAGTPGPKIEDVTGWTGMALGEDGTLYLLSEGTPSVLAWRKP